MALLPAKRLRQNAAITADARRHLHRHAIDRQDLTPRSGLRYPELGAWYQCTV